MDPVSLCTVFPAALKIYSMVNSNQKEKEIISQIALFFEEQNKVLIELKTEIQMLIKGPLYSAKAYLLDASKSHRTKKEQRELIMLAKDKLIDVLGTFQAKSVKTYEDHSLLSIICLNISMCWMALNNLFDSEDWLIASIEECNKAKVLFDKEESELIKKHDRIVKEKNKINSSSSSISTAILVLTPFSPLAVLKEYPKINQKRKLDNEMKQLKRKILKIEHTKFYIDEARQNLQQINKIFNK